MEQPRPTPSPVPQPDAPLAGRVAVVTGAAGGVGHAVASWLDERGARVFSLDRREPEQVVGTFVEVDVLSEASVDAAVRQVVASAERIDDLVAAAGLPRPEGPPRMLFSPGVDVLVGLLQRVGPA